MLALLKWYESTVKAVRGTAEPYIQKRDVVIQVPIYPQSFSPSYQLGGNNRPIIGKTIRMATSPRTRQVASSVSGMPSIEITLTECWPTKLKVGDLDAQANQVWIWEMEIVFKLVSLKFA